MGLCKCPKRTVTNLFCYEHNVNVCEACMVVNHPKCIVQSYLLWLQDNDYNPNCPLCHQNLKDDECVRLICYHVFHWSCLNQRGRGLPPNTAPAGYICPSCDVPILPKDNVVSPVADLLREKLSSVNWARVGLGLPTVSEDEVPKSTSMKQPLMQNAFTTHKNNSILKEKNDIVLHVDDSVYSRPEESAQAVPRRNLHSNPYSRLLIVEDDESKYRRRYSILGLPRWLKSIGSGFYISRRSPWKVLLMMVVMFGLICFIISSLGKITTDSNPDLDPSNNRHLHNG